MDYSLSNEPYKITQEQKILPGSWNPLFITLGLSLLLHSLLFSAFIINKSPAIPSSKPPSKFDEQDTYVPVSVISADSAPTFGLGEYDESAEAKSFISALPTPSQPPVSPPKKVLKDDAAEKVVVEKPEEVAEKIVVEEPDDVSEKVVSEEPDTVAEKVVSEKPTELSNEYSSAEITVDVNPEQNEVITEVITEEMVTPIPPIQTPTNFGRWDIAQALVKNNSTSFQKGGSYNPTSCYVAIQKQNLTINRGVRPCFRASPQFPSNVKMVGRCDIIHSVNKFGRTENIEVAFCSNEVFISSSVEAAKGWYYFPKVHNGQQVKQNNIKVGINYLLRTQSGQIISY